MTDIVQKIHKKNSTVANSFDLSHRRTFMAAPGMLLPVHVMNLMPFQKTYVNYSNFMRTLPLTVPTFGKCKIKFDSYFVPLRLLGNDFQSVIAGDQRGILANYNNNGVYSPKNIVLPRFDYIEMVNEVRIAENGEQPSVFDDLYDSSDSPMFETTPVLLNRLGYGFMDNATSYNTIAAGLSEFGAQNDDLHLANHKNALAPDNGSIDSMGTEVSLIDRAPRSKF